MPEPGESLRPLESILHAVAQMLHCNSAILALVDEAQQALVLALGVNASSVEQVAAVETLLGFPVRGLQVPMAMENTMFVRALRQARVLLAAGREHRSITLEADAHHLMTDVWTSAGVVGGLALVALSGWLWLDAVIAILVGCHILSEGWGLIHSSAHGLLDSAMPDEEHAEIERVLASFHPRDVSYANLRTRRAGSASFVYIDVLVPPHWTILATHDVLDEIEEHIRAVLPHATVITHPEPRKGV